MKNYVENVTNNAKVAIGLAVADKMFELLNINDNYKEYKMGREALDNCWKWLEGGNIEVDVLCNYIDSEDYEDIAEFANSAESTKEIYAWYAALYAVSSTTRQVYRKEENNYPPQIVESVDDDTLITFVEGAVKSEFLKIGILEKVKKYLLEKYPAGSDLEDLTITKEEIMKMVDDNY
ncbi:Imm6 family immunity protein [Metabacillus niabensis]|uniref:Immunity protein Imm6 n=1 Tax=Metabacillus niabensis TaxID=324854 RepID=A0ABT9Z5P5_9BACI|nr:Imm6 family immunity protein [Metabacillus niabensis]MDQ0227325.1 hypothetical protein [Metabacillus niabensis]